MTDAPCCPDCACRIDDHTPYGCDALDQRHAEGGLWLAPCPCLLTAEQADEAARAVWAELGLTDDA